MFSDTMANLRYPAIPERETHKPLMVPLVLTSSSKRCILAVRFRFRSF